MIATGKVQELLDRLQNVTRDKNGWSAQCPSHEDNRNSLSISVGDNGKPLLHCHAGCKFAGILHAVGMSASQFRDDNSGGGFNIAATYDYCDESGNLLFQAVRLQPKGFRQRKPKPGGDWDWSVKGVRVVPYRLPELIGNPDAIVFIAEGEKDVNKLVELGAVATCNAGGAGKWKREHADYLKGRDVVILPDNDDPGREHASKVARYLLGIAETIRIVELPGLKAKGDPFDWITAGGTWDELILLVEESPHWEWEPDDDSGKDEKADQLFPQTDLGNAMQFVHDHGDDIRYCFPWGKWLVWDGKRWRQDDSGEIYQRAKLTVLSMFQQAFGDDSGSSHAAKSQNVQRIEAMIKLARDSRAILPRELDNDPMLLNVSNGTVDLRTGDLLPHRRDDAITKLCPTVYVPDADSKLWRDLLAQTFDNDVELIDWLQRFLGYCLTGQTVEHLLPVFYGTGANGKTTILEAILHAIGEDFSMQAPPNFLMQKRSETHPTEQADLMGKRFVTCVETGDGGRLNEPLLKSLTGGDKIRARFMRQDFFQFDASHKLVLCTNHKPGVRGTDHGIWRRLRLVPFNVTIPDAKQDKQLPAKLRREASAILAWLVEGCLAWQRDGLTSPAAIESATESYRHSEDIVSQFIDDCCVTGPAYKCRASQLFSAYKKWCDCSGEHAVSQRRFGDAMAEKSFVKSRSNGIWYESIGVMDH